MLGGIGPFEVIIVLVIALIVLGPKRLPDAGRSLGEGIRGFRRSLGGDDDRPDPPQVEAGAGGAHSGRSMR
jgi:sec-independent protein translocase protein TatA